MFPRRVALAAILLVSAFSTVACTSMLPFAVAPRPAKVAASVTTSPTATPSTANAAPTSATGATIVRVVNKPTPRPPQDPVLGTRKWGTRSSRVKGASRDVTNDLNSEVETDENMRLIRQQTSELLCVFRHSDGVHRLIEKQGGEPCDATFYVKEINANEDDAGNSTAWITATLRADFPASEGRRGIEMVVYRRKLSPDVLDNTPYIASTQIGWVGRTNGDLVGTDGPDGTTENLLINVNFKN